jgi:outer membrane lipoprotein LolB
MTTNLLLNRFNYFSLLILFISLTACTSVTTQPAQFTPAQLNNAARAQQAQMRMISNWTIRGRIAVQMAQQGGSASVFWKQQGQNYAMEFFGPLGAGAVYLNGIPGQIDLTTSKGQHLQAATPEKLLQQALGWNLPITNLNYWIRGIPAPGFAGTQSFNNQGQLAQLQQDGWQINYLNNMTANNKVLPQYITLVRQGLVVKIIIDSWQLS